MVNVRLAGNNLWDMAVYLDVAGNVCDGVLFCAVLFPTRFLGTDLGLN